MQAIGQALRAQPANRPRGNLRIGGNLRIAALSFVNMLISTTIDNVERRGPGCSDFDRVGSAGRIAIRALEEGLLTQAIAAIVAADHALEIMAAQELLMMLLTQGSKSKPVRSPPVTLIRYCSTVCTGSRNLLLVLNHF
jgi:hypothetical protein